MNKQHTDDEFRAALRRDGWSEDAVNRVMDDLVNPPPRIKPDCPVVDAEGDIWSVARHAYNCAKRRPEILPFDPLIRASALKEWGDGTHRVSSVARFIAAETEVQE